MLSVGNIMSEVMKDEIEIIVVELNFFLKIISMIDLAKNSL